jgi:hypothetical protein
MLAPPRALRALLPLFLVISTPRVCLAQLTTVDPAFLLPLFDSTQPVFLTGYGCGVGFQLGKERDTGELVVDCHGDTVRISPDPQHHLVPQAFSADRDLLFVTWVDTSQPGKLFTAQVDCRRNTASPPFVRDNAALPTLLCADQASCSCSGTGIGTELLIYQTANNLGGINLEVQKLGPMAQPIGPPVALTPPAAGIADQFASAGLIFPGDKAALTWLRLSAASPAIFNELFDTARLAPVPGLSLRRTAPTNADDGVTATDTQNGDPNRLTSVDKRAAAIVFGQLRRTGGLLPVKQLERAVDRVRAATARIMKRHRTPRSSMSSARSKRFARQP